MPDYSSLAQFMHSGKCRNVCRDVKQTALIAHVWLESQAGFWCRVHALWEFRTQLWQCSIMCCGEASIYKREVQHQHAKTLRKSCLQAQ